MTMRADGKPMYYHNYISANIILISDLRFALSNIASLHLAKLNDLRGSKFLAWTGLRFAAPYHVI